MADRSFDQIAVLEISRLFEPLTEVDAALTVLVRELGWRSAAGAELNVDLGDLSGRAQSLIDKGLALARAETDEAARGAAADLVADIPPFIVELRQQIPAIEDALAALADDLVGPSAKLAEKLFARLLDYLLYEYLAKYRPRVFASLHVLGLIERVPDAFGARVRTVHWDRVGLLFTDPLALADETYTWSTEFDGDEFLRRLDLFMRAFLLPGGSYRQDVYVQEALGREPGARELRIPLYQAGRWPTSYTELDLNVSPVPAGTRDGREEKAGLALYPSLANLVQVEETLVGGWVLRLRGTADLAAGLAAELRPPHVLRLTTDLFGENPLGGAEVRLEAGLARAAEADRLFYLFGSEAGSHLAVRQAGVDLILAYEAGAPEIALELALRDLTLAIGSGGADSFLQKLLSGVDILTTCDLVFGYSNLDGVYFRGSGALEVEIPIHRDLGPIRIESVLVGLAIGDGFDIVLAASFSAELGPIAAAVERIGLVVPLEFRSDGRDGNLGPLQIDAPRFKPPTGAGLSLDAGGLAGGGFIEFDDANKRYAGVLGLTFGEIGLVAIGLITTRMPDGSDGFSLLINIGVTFDPAIQLSMGFTLAGVGGLVGVNRTMEVEVLQAGIRNRTLDSILFPDPATVVANADRIISDLRAVFPPADGRFVVGPMVKIGYSTPPIVTADIGIFLELPDPIRVVLMGQVEALLPEPESPVIEIHLDVLGVLDFEKQLLTFQASIYDSRVLKFTIAGDSAFLLGWGDDSRFALSLGGFHPKFDPPPPPIIFSGLRRLSIGISAGSDFQLTCRAYQALTPNSLQFGARVDLYAGSGGTCISGFMGMDALIYFSPFSFEVWIGAGVKIRVEGATLADVYLSFTLSGPDAWSARGTAKIKILFIDINVGFSETWGRSRPSTLPARDPWQPLLEALAAPGNWSAALPAGTGVVEMLRDRKDEPAGRTVVHPGGRIEVRQRIVPLGIRLDKVSNAPIEGHDRFVLAGLEVGGEALDVEPVDEFFARGQFLDLSDAQRLSVPAFERLQAGVRSAAAAAIRAAGEMEVVPVEYESIVIDDQRVATTQPEPGDVDWTVAQPVMRAGAIHRAVQLRGPRARFARPHAQVKVRCTDERYCVANAADLTRAALDASIVEANRDLARVAADQALERQRAMAPDDELIVLPEYEIQGAA